MFIVNVDVDVMLGPTGPYTQETATWATYNDGFTITTYPQYNPSTCAASSTTNDVGAGSFVSRMTTLVLFALGISLFF
jgi:hypothetical protein